MKLPGTSRCRVEAAAHIVIGQSCRVPDRRGGEAPNRKPGGMSAAPSAYTGSHFAKGAVAVRCRKLDGRAAILVVERPGGIDWQARSVDCPHVGCSSFRHCNLGRRRKPAR
jgi:hypothetical protein